MTDFIDRYVGMYDDFWQYIRHQKLCNDVNCTDGVTNGPEVYMQKLGKKVLSFGSLGYLGLSEVPELRKAIGKCHEKYAFGMASSRTIMDTDTHQELERRLAQFKSSEDCLLMNTGYVASSGLIAILINEFSASDKRLSRPKTSVYIDELTHISIKEALSTMKRQDKVVVRSYRHLNYDMLEKQLKRNKEKDNGHFKFIVTDSVFSMNGSIVDVCMLLELAKKYECFIIMDNAHADACYGDKGSGVLSMAGITDAKDLEYFFQAGTLSKAFSLMGGYVTLPHCIANLAKVGHLNYVFSVSSSPANAASAIACLNYIEGLKGDEKRRRLKENAEFFLPLLKERGFNTLNSASHIIPAVVIEDQKSLEIQEYLLHEHGIFVGAVRHPAVKKGEALMRFSLTACHEEEHFDRAIKGLEVARQKFRF